MNVRDINSYRKIYIFLLFVICIFLILEQIITLSIFTYKYNYKFNLGSILKKICNNAYVEFETDRFQIAKDENNLRITNDTEYNHYSNYIEQIVRILTLIYILFIFFSIFGKEYIAGFIDLENTLIKSTSIDILYMILYIFYFISCCFLIALIPLLIMDKYNISKLENKMIFPMLIMTFVLGIMMIFLKKIDFSYFAFIIFMFVILQMISSFKSDVIQQDRSKFSNIFLNLIIDIFYYNKNISNMIILIIVIVISILIISLLQFLKNLNIIDKDETYLIFSKDTSDMKHMINLLIPLLLLFTSSLTIHSSKNFNYYVNENILKKPNDVYRYNLKNISNIFDQMIENNMTNASQGSVCMNAANAIHLVLYNYIFANVDILPRLNYETTCENKSKIIYNDKEEYNPKSYFKELFVDHYKSNKSKCTKFKNVDMGVFITKVYNTNVSHKNFNSSIYNVCIEGKTYNGLTNLKYSDEYEHNNNINSITSSEDKYQDIVPEDVINNIVQNVASFQNKFKDLTILMVKRLRSCKEHTDDNFNIDKIQNILEYYDDVLSNNIKKSYIKRSQKLIEELFTNINNILSNQITTIEVDQKLSKYVVNNFNSFYDKYDKFYGNEFVKIESNGSNMEELDSNKILNNAIQTSQSVYILIIIYIVIIYILNTLRS